MFLECLPLTLRSYKSIKTFPVASVLTMVEHCIIQSNGKLVLKNGVFRRISMHVWSGVGTYAGAARRRVHLATVLLQPPSGHRPDRRQARHVHILQTGLHLTQP